MKKTIVALLIAVLSIDVFAQTKDIKTALDEANKLYKTIEELESVIEIERSEYIMDQIKDEFETTSEFYERIDKEVKNKYKTDFDKLDNYNIDLALLLNEKHIFPKDSYNVELVRYDADNCEYEINFINYMIKNPIKKDEWLSKKLILKIDPKTAKEIKINWGSYPVELYGELSYDGQNYTVGSMELCFLDSNKTNLVCIKIDIYEVEGMIFVEGGTFMSWNSNYFDKETIVDSFFIGKYEVTQAEWIDVMGSNPSYFKGDNLPVEAVSWYDCVEYCNKRSVKEGLTPVYMIDKTNKDLNNTSTKDNIKWTVTADWSANGYRLPTEVEWEYSATGGQKSNSFTYSGNDDIDEVAEYKGNNNKSTKPVGGKKPNELGIYDMSGNVWEWTWDWYNSSITRETNFIESSSGSGRVIRGGSWINYANYCEIFNRDGGIPDYRNYNVVGFRIVLRGE